MFLILIRRELLANLMTFRFLVAMIVTLSLVVANTVVLIADYERRLISYNTAVKQHSQKGSRPGTYSYMEGQILVDRPPNPLSIFNAGLDRRLGNSINVEHTLVPTLWDTHSHSADNPFLNLFSSVDLVLIFQVILSLLALLFAHDAIAGERELRPRQWYAPIDDGKPCESSYYLVSKVHQCDGLPDSSRNHEFATQTGHSANLIFSIWVNFA